MIPINTLGSDDRLEKTRKLKFSSVLHRIACIYGALIAAFLLFMCVLSVLNAEQDIHKYEHTGTFSYFLYFLNEYEFTEHLCMFLLAIAELLFYFAQCHPIKKKGSSRGSVWYLGAILVLHIIIWLHANSLPIPDTSPYTEVEEAALTYRFFANVTVSPTVGYFVSYLSRMYMVRSTRSI